MDLFSIFKGGKYFDKHIQPKCDYCQFGRRAKDGEKIICEKRGLVQREDSCSKFIYSPLKRIPKKQLNFVGSLADEDIYTESVSEIAEKQAELEKSSAPKSNRKPVPENNDVQPESENTAETAEKAESVDIASDSEQSEPPTEETAESSSGNE